MQTRTMANPSSFMIKDEHDIVPMRQAIRQYARDHGLGLIQQAKIAAAISTATRALITAPGETLCHRWMLHSAEQLALEMRCSFTIAAWITDRNQLEQMLRFDEIRMLVDEASVSIDLQNATLVLRMKLTTEK